MAELTPKQQEDILDDLRWYGHMIAGGAPMVGHAKVAKEAESHWYKVTLPMLQGMGEVYKEKHDGDNTTTPEG